MHNFGIFSFPMRLHGRRYVHGPYEEGEHDSDEQTEADHENCQITEYFFR